MPLLASFSEACACIDPGPRSELGGTTVRAGFGRSHLLELVVYAPVSTLRPGDVESMIEALIEAQLGAGVLDEWIGSIEVVPAPRRGPLTVLQPSRTHDAGRPLENLAETISAAVDGLRRGLSDRPCHERCDVETWVMFELEPDLSAQVDTKDGPPQSDLVTATTWMPEMLRCLLRGDPFYSGRFSRLGERFYYLELFDAHLAEQTRLVGRQQLEDAINTTLRQERLGCVVGSGIGLRRSYIDLAVVDLQRSLPLLGPLVTRSHQIRCWLHAADTPYRGQKLPLHGH